MCKTNIYNIMIIYKHLDVMTKYPRPEPCAMRGCRPQLAVYDDLGRTSTWKKGSSLVERGEGFSEL